ncbi:MAG: heme utilization cystosolic carrier protein HutX [Desulfovibrionaceae bacterium]|jgi:putative heme utilization carrier protein HutX
MTNNSPHLETIRERISENPSLMPMALADELNLPEAEVVRCLPEEMRVEAPASEFEAIWEAMTGWEKVTFIARNPGAVVEVSCRLPKGRHGHGMFNLMERGNPLGGHLFADRIGSIWLVSKPFFNMESHSVQFFDVDGAAMFAVYLGRDDKRAIIGSVREGFLELCARYGDGEVL